MKLLEDEVPRKVIHVPIGRIRCFGKTIADFNAQITFYKNRTLCIGNIESRAHG